MRYKISIGECSKCDIGDGGSYFNCTKLVKVLNKKLGRAVCSTTQNRNNTYGFTIIAEGKKLNRNKLSSIIALAKLECNNKAEIYIEEE